MSNNQLMDLIGLIPGASYITCSLYGWFLFFKNARIGKKDIKGNWKKLEQAEKELKG